MIGKECTKEGETGCYSEDTGSCLMGLAPYISTLHGPGCPDPDHTVPQGEFREEERDTEVQKGEEDREEECRRERTTDSGHARVDLKSQEDAQDTDDEPARGSLPSQICRADVPEHRSEDES